MGLFRGFSGMLAFALASVSSFVAGSVGWNMSETYFEHLWTRALGVLLVALIVFWIVRVIVRKLVNGLLAQPADAVFGLLSGVILGALVPVGWIFDPAQVPEDITRYWEPPIDPSQTRYPEIQLSQEEEELLAKVIWAEARGESLEGQQAVAEVVLNRMVSEKFGGSLRNVVYAAGQFHGVSSSQFRQADPGQAQYQAIARALHGPNILPMDVLYFGTAPPEQKYLGRYRQACVLL